VKPSDLAIQALLFGVPTPVEPFTGTWADATRWSIDNNVIVQRIHVCPEQFLRFAAIVPTRDTDNVVATAMIEIVRTFTLAPGYVVVHGYRMERHV
jgi:hypothetical protein